MLAQQIGLLAELGATRSPVLVFTIDMAWAGVFFGLVWQLQRRSFRRTTLVLIMLDIAYQAIRLSLLTTGAVAGAWWPIRLLPLAAFGLFAAWALFRPANRAYWGIAGGPSSRWRGRAVLDD